MIRKIDLNIEKLPDGQFLVSSDDMQGLVAQGRTVNEAIEIARDVARKLIEMQKENNETPINNILNEEKFEIPMLIEE